MKTKRKKIIFYEQKLLLMFMYGLSEVQNFKYSNKGLPHQWISDDFIFELNNLETWLENDSNLDYYMAVMDVHSYHEYHKNKNWDSHINQLKEHLKSTPMKLLLVDWIGEYYGLNETQEQFLIDTLDDYSNTYLLSQRRLFGKDVLGYVGNQPQLSLLYYWFYICDNLFYHPPLPTFESKNKPYDFISYFGLNHIHDKNQKEHPRNIAYERINFNGKSLHIPHTFEQLKPIQQELTNSDLPQGNMGRYNWFSILESEQAKIKLVFESYNPTIVSPSLYEKYGFLSEKTTKCFTHTQPYILLIGKEPKQKLLDLGFQLPCPLDYDDTIDYISDLCKGDLDEWIKEHQSKFVHNKKLFESIIYDNKQLHNKFFMDVINNKVNKQRQII